VFGFIDSVHTSDEERLVMKAKLMEHYQPILLASVELEKTAAEMRVKVLELEGKSDRWLVWSWRPVTMYLLLANVMVSHWAPMWGVQNAPDATMSWNALMMGLGFIGGTRGIEKIVRVLKAKEKI
jgi:hypothetical protein